jgi:hypothetical protein
MTPLAADLTEPAHTDVHATFAELQAIFTAFVADPAMELGTLAAAECIATQVFSVVQWASATDPARALEAATVGLDALAALRTGGGNVRRLDVRALVIRALRAGFATDDVRTALGCAQGRGMQGWGTRGYGELGKAVCGFFRDVARAGMKQRQKGIAVRTYEDADEILAVSLNNDWGLVDVFLERFGYGTSAHVRMRWAAAKARDMARMALPDAARHFNPAYLEACRAQGADACSAVSGPVTADVLS